MISTGGLTTISIGIGAAGAATVLWLARSREADTAKLIVRGALVVGGLAMALAMWLLTLPFTSFLLAHALYLVMVLSVPILGLGCAAAWLRLRPRRSLAAVSVVLILPAAVGAYATHVAPYRLREDHVALEVDDARAPDGTLRIGVLSDLQLIAVTDHERTAVDRLMAQEPDLILIAGDFFQGSEEQFVRELADYRELLGRLDAPGGVFAVRGDVDGNAVDLLVDGTEVEVLDDEVASVDASGRRVTIGGLRLDWESTDARQVYAQLAEVPPDELAIMLSHRPDSVLDLPPDARVDLTVAGHTHGGQIAVPFLGPLTTMSDVPRKVGAGGLHEIDGNPIYISSGVGLERQAAPQVRLFTRPSFGIIDVSGGS